MASSRLIVLTSLIGLLLSPAVYLQAAEATVSPGENFLVPVIKGWKLNTTDNQNSVITSEFVPAGETTPGWSELMSLQIFIGKRDLAPKDFAQRVIKVFGQRCESYDGGKPLLMNSSRQKPCSAVTSSSGGGIHLKIPQY